jgi:hypothetical protein
MSLLDDRLSALAAMSQAQLRAEWRRVHKGQVMPSGLGRDLASRAIAWRMQEHLNGGLPPAALRELNRLKPGTKLVRAWHRRIYHVLVLEDGFQFEDRHYRSLTGIAREITGAAWSGPRFFGVKGKANVPPSR